MHAMARSRVRPRRPSFLVGAAATLLALAAIGAGPVDVAAVGGPRVAPVAEPIVVSHGPRTRRVVALTFDDCRDRDGLVALFDGLVAEGVPATFFPYGYALRASPDVWSLVAAAGYPIGNHTLTHRDLAFLDDAGTRYEFRAWRAVALDEGLTPIPYARPPYGSYTATTVRAAGEEGYRAIVMWDVDTRDWAGLSTAEIVARAVAGSNGSIVLMHCGLAAARALPAIVARYRELGFGFVTVPELLEGTGPPRGHDRLDPSEIRQPARRRAASL